VSFPITILCRPFSREQVRAACPIASAVSTVIGSVLATPARRRSRTAFSQRDPLLPELDINADARIADDFSMRLARFHAGGCRVRAVCPVRNDLLRVDTGIRVNSSGSARSRPRKVDLHLRDALADRALRRSGPSPEPSSAPSVEITSTEEGKIAAP